jgi:hypothetical protein
LSPPLAASQISGVPLEVAARGGTTIAGAFANSGIRGVVLAPALARLCRVRRGVPDAERPVLALERERAELVLLDREDADDEIREPEVRLETWRRSNGSTRANCQPSRNLYLFRM